jgi:hypothetical protein
LTNVLAVFLGVAVSIMPRAQSLRLLFFAWVCFSLAFSTVFQAFFILFLIDSGYKPQIQNMDELFESGIKLAYPPEYSFVFENGRETEVSNLRRNQANCPSLGVCLYWAIYQKNVSVLLFDMYAEVQYVCGYFVGQNSEPLICRLEDGVLFPYSLRMMMLHADPLMRRVSEIIDRVVEAGLINYTFSLYMNLLKVYSEKIAIVQPLDGYCSFKMYHIQPAFYLLLMGCGLSSLCFVVELLYNRCLRKRK